MTPLVETSDTRRALLDEARRCFANDGFDGASVRSITSGAGANLGAVTYHFGSKERLYEEVLAEALAPLSQRIQAALKQEGTALDRASSVVGAFFQHFAEHPDTVRLMLQQIASGRPPPVPVQHIMGGAMAGLASVIAHGQSAGEIREGNPALMALSIVSQPVYLSIVQPLLAQATDLRLKPNFDFEVVVGHATRFARAGLTAAPSPEAPA